jgi:hypothetical protein
MVAPTAWGTSRGSIAWTERADVIAVVENLADERMRPRKIAALLGLKTGEVLTILRRTGR